MARRLLSIPLMLTAVTLFMVGVARADTVHTTTCASSQPLTWRIGYRLYWADDQGRATDRAALPGVVSEAQKFADALGTDSGCSLAASIDVIDMQDAVWPSSHNQPSSNSPPDGYTDFAAANNYDATFYRYPRDGNETYSGITSGIVRFTPEGDGDAYPWSIFPVDPTGRAYANDLPQDPWYLLLMHEFMHEIVGFYDPAQGWPVGDVHGACEHPAYANTGASCGVVEPYFADMLQGKIMENGRATGMLASDYLKDGTPRHSVRRYATFQVGSNVNGISVSTPTDFDGQVAVSVLAGGQAIATGQAATGKTTIPVAPGSYTVKLDFNGSVRYRPQHASMNNIQSFMAPSTTGQEQGKPINGSKKKKKAKPRCRVPNLRGMTLIAARRKLRSAHCATGHVTRRRGHGRIRVRSQNHQPGAKLAGGTKVALTIGPPRR